ncbi:MAG: ABC transporter ATP-binding protein [Casimicrobiaceae bacterium]|nr:ABC transporter ATP-binding protein [Casimicrobiaceae bacterium]MCX8098434.1 ABC transporter ATP-binding protein [Casimicrobiaceae bacterium]MDW8311146.1 ABC transporter ATP-binding protein [Burkholderiales bacterium]
MSCLPALAFERVSKRFGSLAALDQVSFSVEQGEFFALLGPNGAGKTTLISILAGLVRPSSGRAFVLGWDVVREPLEARARLGVVPQELVFDPFFTVRETLELQARYYGLRPSRAWIEELLAELGLEAKADTNLRALSGGQKRRVMVGQALVHKPPVIVLDEPTAGVDVELRQGLWRFIKRLNAEGHTIVLTTHYLEEAESLCTRVAMLKAGRVVALDATERLLRNLGGIQVEVVAERVPESLAGRAIAQASGAFGFTLPEPAALEPLLAAFREAGIAVRELRVGGADLETAFLRLTGRHATPHAHAA